MQEIAEHVYIERAYPGVTLGAISWPHGLVLIDAPFRMDDVRSWRAALLNLGGGVDRLLVNLDVHVDRTLGARAMECTVVGHEKMAQVFRNRPVTFKAQGIETGAEWERYNGIGSVRWAPPEITFTERMSIYWNDTPLVLEYHPGPAAGAVWAVLPAQKIVFIGDTVVYDMPPFLAGANISAWLESLELLSSKQYQNYLLVNGRNGLVTARHVRQQISFLNKVQARIESLVESKANPEDSAAFVPELLKSLDIPVEYKEVYFSRLKWGLAQYFVRHFRSHGEEIED